MPNPGPGLAERRLNVMESRAARGAAHADTKKSFGLDWKSLKSNTSKLEGKENELVRNKEAVKNRPLTVQGHPVHDTGNRKVERKTEGRKVDSQSSSSASVVKTAMTAAAPKKCPVHGGDTGSRTHAAAADKKPGKLDYLSKQLKSPSLLSRTLTKKSDDRTTNNEMGHKNNTLKEKPKQTSSTDTFAPRRPERSSIRRHKSSTTINSNNSSSSTEQEQQHFQRRWSFRLPHTMKQPSSSSSGQAVSARPPPAQPDSSLTSSSLSLLPPPPPSSAPSSSSSSSSSGLWGGPLKIPDYFRVGDRARQ